MRKRACVYGDKNTLGQNISNITLFCSADFSSDRRQYMFTLQITAIKIVRL